MLPSSSSPPPCQVFRDDEQAQQKPLRDAWFSVGLTDRAAFLLVLSNSALHLNSIGEGGLKADDAWTATAIRYQTEAVAIINQRLSTDLSDTLDATIGTVSGLVCNAVCLYLFYEGRKPTSSERTGVKGFQ